MKIVAGLGCIDDYIRLAEAGADEVFCGYVPYEWNTRYRILFIQGQGKIFMGISQTWMFSGMHCL